MEDSEIYDLFWARNEQAIAATHQKYGTWCKSIAHRILNIMEETEECVSDTYMTAWNHIPPERPSVFRAWLGKITRNLALTRYRKLHAAKRGGGETTLALDELSFCVSGKETPEDSHDAKETLRIINEFLSMQPTDHRNIFVRRYWYVESVKSIAAAYHMSENRVSTILSKQRKLLKQRLQEEGVAV